MIYEAMEEKKRTWHTVYCNIDQSDPTAIKLQLECVVPHTECVYTKFQIDLKRYRKK